MANIPYMHIDGIVELTNCVLGNAALKLYSSLECSINFNTTNSVAERDFVILQCAFSDYSKLWQNSIPDLSAYPLSAYIYL